jgi:hypothetical protein
MASLATLQRPRVQDLYYSLAKSIEVVGWQAVGDHCFMSVADLYLVELGAPADAWEREAAVRLVESPRADPAVVFDEERLLAAARPMVRFMIRFAVGLWPGTDVAGDATWVATGALARRQVAINSEAGIDGGMADLNLAVLDWIDSRVAGGGDRDFRSRVREEIDGLLDAGRRGRQRGAELSALWEREGHPDPLWSSSTTAGFLLRHPNDHYLLDGQIAVMAASYDRLMAGTPGRDDGELIVELQVGDTSHHGRTEPVPTTVVAVAVGAATVGDQIGLRLVADPDAAFNGTLISVRTGERWLTCGDLLHDGTIIPRDRTRRLAA